MIESSEEQEVLDEEGKSGTLGTAELVKKRKSRLLTIVVTKLW